MDPVIAVLLQAAGVVGGALANEGAKRAVGEAWDRALAAIKRCVGANDPTLATAERLRLAAPDESSAAPVREQLSKMRFGDSPDLLTAVQPLAAALTQQGVQLPAIYVNTIKGAAVVMGNQTNTFNEGL